MIHNQLCNLFSALEAGCKSYMENHGRKEKGTAPGNFRKHNFSSESLK